MDNDAEKMSGKSEKKRFEESAAHEFVEDRSGQTARTLNTPKSGPDYPQ